MRRFIRWSSTDRSGNNGAAVLVLNDPTIESSSEIVTLASMPVPLVGAIYEADYDITMNPLFRVASGVGRRAIGPYR